MRALRVLGLAEDGHNLVCEDGTSGELFTVPSDERLRAAVRGDLSRLGQLQIELEPQLRPREIQARIRAGAPSPRSPPRRTPASGASSATPTRCCWSDRRRRRRPGSRTRSSTATRPARTSRNWSWPPSASAARTPSVQWDAYRDDDGWVVALRWQAGRSENSAHWEIHSGSRTHHPAPQGRRRPGADGSGPAPAAHHRRPARPRHQRWPTSARRITDAARAASPKLHRPRTDLQQDAVRTRRERRRPGRSGGASRHPAGSRRALADRLDQEHMVEQTVLDERSGACSRPATRPANIRRAPGPAPTTRPAVGTARVSGPSCRAGKTSCSAAGKPPTCRHWIGRSPDVGKIDPLSLQRPGQQP